MLKVPGSTRQPPSTRRPRLRIVDRIRPTTTRLVLGPTRTRLRPTRGHGCPRHLSTFPNPHPGRNPRPTIILRRMVCPSLRVSGPAMDRRVPACTVPSILSITCATAPSLRYSLLLHNCCRLGHISCFLMSLQLIPFMITIETDDSHGVPGLIVLFRLFFHFLITFYFSLVPSATGFRISQFRRLGDIAWVPISMIPLSFFLSFFCPLFLRRFLRPTHFLVRWPKTQLTT